MITDYLLRGKGNAIPGHKLVEILGLKNQRELTQLIERSRRIGIPICASTNAAQPGYYIAATPRELEQYIKSLDHRLQSIATTRLACAATLDEWTGQQQMEAVE